MDRDRSEESIAAAVLDGIPIFIAYLDRDLTFTLCNVAAAFALGRARDDVVGSSMPDLIGDDARMTRALREAIETGAATSLVFTANLAELPGEPRTFAGSFVPDRGPDGEVRGVFANAFDVTDQMIGLRTAADLGESLNVILQSIAAERDPLRLLNTLAAESLDAIHGDYSLVSVKSGRSWVVAHRHGTGGEDRIGLDYPLSERPVIQSAADTGEIQFVEDAWHDPSTNKQIMSEFGVKSFVAVPLTLRGETLGVFELVFTHAHRTFDSATRVFLRNIASAASLAYGRMVEYEHERRIADTLQSALLHLPSTVRGLRYASHYAAASEEALVGGDFFDVFEIDAGKVGITIGDVSGKGLSAAIITSRVRDSLRLCALDGLGPAACVTKTNRLLYRITPSDVFATLVFAILDTITGELTYVSAAHPPGVLQRADGNCELLEGSGSLVGAFMTLEFTQRSLMMCAGDALVLYTDGLTESRRDGEMYGVERIVAFLGGRNRSSLEALVSEVFNEVREFTRHRLRDDVAMLAISLDWPRPASEEPASAPE
jgi:GAF domain-containing protein